MRLHVVYNQDGEILAAVQLDLESPVRARPIPDKAKGHQIADVYVPTEYSHYDVGAICAKLKVHGPPNSRELKPKGDYRSRHAAKARGCVVHHSKNGRGDVRVGSTEKVSGSEASSVSSNNPNPTWAQFINMRSGKYLDVRSRSSALGAPSAWLRAPV